MSYSETSVRHAVERDAHAIALVHVESSASTYAALIPQKLLGKFPLEKREQIWEETLKKADALTFVGCNFQQEIVGFVTGGAERSGQLECDGELYAIYLLPAEQRKGLGTLLVQRFARELTARGFRSMAVWVLAGNPARQFYEALGAQLVSQKSVETGGEILEEVAYHWADLSEF